MLLLRLFTGALSERQNVNWVVTLYLLNMNRVVKLGEIVTAEYTLGGRIRFSVGSTMITVIVLVIM